MRTADAIANDLTRMVDNTPDDRDRYVDFLRAFSILVVVVGHWLMAIIYLDADGISGANALELIPGLWLTTWVLQVMPLFFLVGGFSNLVAWRSARRKELTYADFLRGRVVRLMRPTLVFIGAWTVAAIVIRAAAPQSFEGLRMATELLAKPLWFLAVYVLVVAVAPLMLACHERYGIRVLVALGGAAALVDIARIGLGVPGIGYLNFAFVWLFAHQLGFFYADGVLTKFSKRFHVGLAALSVGALALLTGSGIYSPSMVGMQTEAASNNSPPTVCLIVLTLWLTSAAMLARPTVSRWLHQRRVWKTVVATNSMIMTIFLWHLTAAMVAVLILFPLGFPQPRGGTAVWWTWRPVWLVVLTVVLTGFVALFARFERPALPRHVGEARTPKLTVIGGVAALVAGLAGFAQFGFALGPITSTTQLPAQPLFNALLVAVGYHALANHSRSIGG
jgi:fucose 4-O-acetylase-like acetyltransferase